MELFLDTAEVEEVREIASWGILDGVTTNPSLIKKSGRDFKKVISEIAKICDGPISAEVTALDAKGMITEEEQLKAELPENVIIKVPCTPEGLIATKALSSKGNPRLDNINSIMRAMGYRLMPQKVEEPAG